ncbi:MAG: hypothetical protein ABJA37_07385 [Ferruginibacter sp.]
MKKILFRLLFLSVVSSLIFSCKKESTSGDDPHGPDVLLRTEGFLCTIGISRTGAPDTLTFYFGTNGENVSGYSYGYTRASDKVHISPSGDNSVSIIKNIPYVSGGKNYNYFGIKANSNPVFSSFPNNQYLYYLYAEASTETEFVVKRDDLDNTKFTIESKSHPGYYLGTARWINATYPTEANLVFTREKQKFFFVVQ